MVTEYFSWPIIDDVLYVFQHFVGDFAFVGFGQELSDDAVGVFDGAFLPRAVGVAEEGLAWQIGMSGKLQAIIQRNGFWLVWRNCFAQSLGHIGSVFTVRIVHNE